jgi:nucleoside-diphosphate-sugar epimerase
MIEMQPDARVFVAGHRGLVGSAVVRRLEQEGFSRILTATHRAFSTRSRGISSRIAMASWMTSRHASSRWDSLETANAWAGSRASVAHKTRFMIVTPHISRVPPKRARGEAAEGGQDRRPRGGQKNRAQGPA